MTFLSQFARSERDPRLLKSGSGSLGLPDRLAKGLGWFSLALGAAELFAPGRITRPLGLQGKETIVRAYGMREIASGLLSLSIDKKAGLWSRVAGDVVDLVTLFNAMRPGARRNENLTVAMVVVLGVTLLDLLSSTAVTVAHRRPAGSFKRYADRSGYPQGVEDARGAARGRGMAGAG